MMIVLLAVVCIGGTAYYTNYLSSRQSGGGKQTRTDPSPVVDKTKAIESDAPIIDPKNGTVVTPDPLEATIVQLPVAPKVAGNPTPIPAREQERMDLEKLAVTVIPCLFLIEVFDVSGSSIGKVTGFSVSADGLVATNHHVVQNGQTYSLVTSHGAKFDNAEVIVSDPDTDLAIIKIEAKDLPYLPLVESSKM